MRFIEYTVHTNHFDEDEFYALNPKLLNSGYGRGQNLHTLESLDSIWIAVPKRSQESLLKIYEMIMTSENRLVYFHELLDELK